MSDRISTVFFGTPAYAASVLESLASDERFDLRLVVTQPDRPAGRGKLVVSPPVKDLADSLQLSVYQPESLRTPELRQPLVDADADLFVVAAYGLIFGPKTLAIPRIGALNLHASLLPKYRGASPVTAAILQGDEVTGVTLMRMEEGLDTGPIIAGTELSMGSDDTTESLTPKLGALAGALAARSIPEFLAGKHDPVPQPEIGASIVRQLVKEDGRIDWWQSAEAIERHIRAMWSWPRAFTSLGNEVLQIHSVDVVDDSLKLKPGEVRKIAGRILVGIGSGSLELKTVQSPGGKPISALSWFAGLRSNSVQLGGTVESPEGRPLIVPV